MRQNEKAPRHLPESDPGSLPCWKSSEPPPFLDRQRLRWCHDQFLIRPWVRNYLRKFVNRSPKRCLLFVFRGSGRMPRWQIVPLAAPGYAANPKQRPSWRYFGKTRRGMQCKLRRKCSKNKAEEGLAEHGCYGVGTKKKKKKKKCFENWLFMQ